MEGNGPASPDLRDIGLILASDNGVALDAVIAVMMGLEPGRLRFLQKAKETGLGDYDLDTIEVIGELKRLPDFKLPPLGGEVVLQNPDMQEMLHSRTLMRPRADPELCTGCGTCIDQCPVSALSRATTSPRWMPTPASRAFAARKSVPRRPLRCNKNAGGRIFTACLSFTLPEDRPVTLLKICFYFWMTRILIGSLHLRRLSGLIIKDEGRGVDISGFSRAGRSHQGRRCRPGGSGRARPPRLRRRRA